MGDGNEHSQSREKWVLLFDRAVSPGPGHGMQWGRWAVNLGRTPKITRLFCSEIRTINVKPFVAREDSPEDN